MRLTLSLVLTAFVALSACDASAPADTSSASSDEIIAAHAAAASSSTCDPPSLAFGSLSSFGSHTVVATPANASTDVSVSIEESLGGGFSPVHGEAYNGSPVEYATDWGPPEGRPQAYASYRARTMCDNGFLSGYSNTITTGIDW